MSDVHLIELAGRQFNRISWAQLKALGYGEAAIEHRLRTGRLARAEVGVYAVAPLLDSDRARWMTATLTAPDSHLCRASAAAALGFWSLPRAFESVTRPGSGGPQRHGGVLVFRSRTLAGETTTLGPIPITIPERVLLDLAASVSAKALARCVREALRLEVTSLDRIVGQIGRHRGERGTRRLAAVAARYAGLPLERARSGAEARAMVALRDAGRELPRLNVRVAGEEADLSWTRHRLIVEIDGAPFHRDRGEDERKQSAWESAGWAVVRIPSEDVYERPHRLLALAP